MKNTFVKVLSFVMALMMVVGTFGTLAVFAEEVACDHKKGDLIETVAPKCNALGFSRYTCSECGEEWVTDVVLADAKYHNYVEVAAIEASCLTNAWTAGKACEYCHQGYEGQGPKEQVGTQLQHDFVRAKVEATCDDNAKYVSTCKLCGKTAEWLNGDNDDKKNYFTEDQKYSDWKEEELTGEGNVALNPGHKKLDWVVETLPVSADGKCTDGLAVGTCEFCDHKETAVIKNEHKLDKELNKDGLPCIGWEKGSKQCTVCGYIDGKAVDTSKVGHTVDYTWTGEFDKTNLPYKGATATNATQGDRFTIAELEAFGYKNGDDFVTEADCTKAGRALVRCQCGHIYVKDEAMKAHSYADWSEIETVWPDACDKAATKTRYCQNATADSDHWKASKEVKEIAPAAASAHNFVKADTSKAATCTEVGVNNFVCNNKYTTVENGVPVEKTCGKAGETTYDEALGHNWGAAKYKEGNCEDNTLVWARQCATCKVFDTNVEIPAEAKKHTFGAEVEVAATCLKKNHKTQTCSVCEYVKEIEVEGAEKNPANHVYPTGDALLVEGAHVDFVTGKEPTCTTKGQAIVTCTNPECASKATDKTVETGTTAHDLTGDYKVTNGSTTTVVDIDDLSEFSESNKDGYKVSEGKKYKPATCTAVGYWNDGKICMVCGHVDTKATEIDKDPDNHSGTLTKRGDVVPATCQEPKYQMYNASCCGLVKVHLDDKKASCTDNLVSVPFKAPDCENAGNHFYKKCGWCGTKQVFSTTDAGCDGSCGINHETLGVNDNHVIPALGHNYDEKNDAGVELAKIAGYRETCQETGIRDYYGCLNCYSAVEVEVLVEGDDPVLKTVYSGYAKVGDKEYNLDDDDEVAAFLTAITIAPHYKSKAELKTPVAATCATDGVAARPAGEYLGENVWCTVCDVNADGVGNWVISKDTVAHTVVEFKAGYDKETGKVIDCTKPTCVIKTCSVCDWTETVLTPGAEKHNMPEEYEEVTPDASKGQYICNTDTYKIKQCADCMVNDKETVSEKIGCYTTKGVPGGEKFFFDFACNKIAEHIGFRCDLCNDLVEWTDIEHKKVGDKVEETCEALGYEISYCALCNYTDADKEHDFEIVTKVLDDMNPKGVNGHNIEDADTVILERVEAVGGVDGFVRYICGVCGEETQDTLVAHVVVDTTVTVDTDFVSAGSMIKVTVSASAEALSFYELAIALNLNGAFKVVENSDYKVAPGAALGEYALVDVTNDLIVIYNENDENNEPVATTLDGENIELVTFYVAVKEAVAEPTYVIDTDALGAVTGFNEDGTDHAIVVEDNGEDVEITVVSIGDLNQDGSIGRRDISMMKAYIEDFAVNGVYNAVADVNRDGSVDVVDIAALRAFVKENLTISAYLKLIGEDLDAALVATKAPSNVAGLTDAGDRQIIFNAAVKAVADSLQYTDYIALCNKLEADSAAELLAKIVKVIIEESTLPVANQSVVINAGSVVIRTNDGDITVNF